MPNKFRDMNKWQEQDAANRQCACYGGGTTFNNPPSPNVTSDLLDYKRQNGTFESAVDALLSIHSSWPNLAFSIQLLPSHTAREQPLIPSWCHLCQASQSFGGTFGAHQLRNNSSTVFINPATGVRIQGRLVRWVVVGTTIYERAL
jgi:hypothetical protein